MKGRRGRAETKNFCVKLPGQRLMVRHFGCTVAEAQVRIASFYFHPMLGMSIAEATE